jgi:hypothetical protein
MRPLSHLDKPGSMGHIVQVPELEVGYLSVFSSGVEVREAPFFQRRFLPQWLICNYRETPYTQ